MLKAAAYFDQHDDLRVTCRLCPLECSLTEGQAGICKSRFNKSGELVTDNYGELVSLAVDPIEKKPLYHFYPGSEILSTGPNCCNLGCRHCQNWEISQQRVRTRYFTPEQLLTAALRGNSLGVAFTYTEPMIWYEYIMDVAPALRQAGLKVVMVTNGFINPKPLKDYLSVCDAMNIDLKSINPSFYKKICKGSLEPVLDSIRTVNNSDCHLELTNLVIPAKNDDSLEIDKLINFVAELSPDIPFHLSAYHPSYEMSQPATPEETLTRFRDRAKEKLNYVYVGNLPLDAGNSTCCPSCGHLLIKRSGHAVQVVGLNNRQCEACECELAIVC